MPVMQKAIWWKIALSLEIFSMSFLYLHAFSTANVGLVGPFPRISWLVFLYLAMSVICKLFQHAIAT